MYRFFFKFWFLFFLLVEVSFAQDMTDAFKEFSKGSYSDSLAILEKIRGNNDVMSTRAYLKGLCHNRMQEFDKSIVQFQEAIKLGNDSKDLYYELGQAYYAANDLEASRKSFEESFRLGYQKDTSLYYLAHISQILEQNDLAKKYYNSLANLPEASKNLKQIATFQLGEVFLSLARDKEESEGFEETRRRVKEFVLPKFDEAIVADKESSTAEEIKKRIREVQKQYELDPTKMRNGRSIPDQRWTLSFTQKVTYDNNISLANDQPTVQATQKESYVFDSSLDARYVFVSKQRYQFAPQINLGRTIHEDQDNTAVFQNDSYTISPSLRNKIEHRFRGNPATLGYDFDYVYTARDFDANRDLSVFSRAITYSLYEKLRILGSGDTTIRFKYKASRAENRTLSLNAGTVSIDQLAVFPNGTLLIFLFNADFNNNFNDKNSSTNSYLTRFDYIIPNIMESYTMTLAMSTTVLDTKKQKRTRGTEKTYSPSVKMSKNINKHMVLTGGYTYTKNASKQSSLDYTKHQTSLDLKYIF